MMPLSLYTARPLRQRYPLRPENVMPDSSESSQSPSFYSLGLSSPLLKALDEVGYESPSPIQARTIPPLLAGRNVLGQAQTGTGKTAAFALPLLQHIDLKQAAPQALVLTPTRELAIQVAEAIRVYARYLKSFFVLPVYGGQDFSTQIRGLRRGSHVVVGTPGRIMDHMRRGTLQLDSLKTLVLDEADEMLRMGFIDDVEWILEQLPDSHQTALFSATMPPPIRRIAQQYLQEAEEITIEVKTTTADTIRQRYWPVKGVHKLDALTRILEAEEFDAMIVFVRTKTATVELAEKLAARGFASAPLNGDMSQQLRERTVTKLKKGELDIVVATDVAARGLDVERISHVVNYDVPHDTEAYVHRIGRTGRAGRSGDAILFVAPREKRMLQAIERATRQPIALMELPSAELIANQRIGRFREKVQQVLEGEDLSLCRQLVEQMQAEFDREPEDLAAALAWLAQGDQPFQPVRPEKLPVSDTRGRDRGNVDRAYEPENRRPARAPTILKALEPGMERYRIEVGHNHGVKPGNIVGAIANEAGLESRYIGRIAIYEDYSVLDLPEGMPEDTFALLQDTWVAGRKLHIARCSDQGEPIAAAADRSSKGPSSRGRGGLKACNRKQPRQKPQGKAGKSDKGKKKERKGRDD